MSNKRIYIIAGALIIIVVAAGFIALISMAGRNADIRQENIVPTSTAQEEIKPPSTQPEARGINYLDEEANATPEEQRIRLGGGSGGGGGAAGQPGIPAGPIDEELPVCPSILEIGYLVDYKDTTTATDDDIYISIKNYKPFEDDVKVYIDGNYEGQIEIRGLGVAILKSGMITPWWRNLNDITSKQFRLRLEPMSCAPITTSITVIFPPAEGDYLD